MYRLWPGIALYTRVIALERHSPLSPVTSLSRRIYFIPPTGHELRSIDVRHTHSRSPISHEMDFFFRGVENIDTTFNRSFQSFKFFKYSKSKFLKAQKLALNLNWNFKKLHFFNRQNKNKNNKKPHTKKRRKMYGRWSRMVSKETICRVSAFWPSFFPCTKKL